MLDRPARRPPQRKNAEPVPATPTGDRRAGRRAVRPESPEERFEPGSELAEEDSLEADETANFWYHENAGFPENSAEGTARRFGSPSEERRAQGSKQIVSSMKKIRINELARELEVKAHEILDRLPELGVTEKKTHSSSIDEDVAMRLRSLWMGYRRPGLDARTSRRNATDGDRLRIHACGRACSPRWRKSVRRERTKHPEAAHPEPAPVARTETPPVEPEKPAPAHPAQVAPVRPPLAGRPIHPPARREAPAPRSRHRGSKPPARSSASRSTTGRSSGAHHSAQTPRATGSAASAFGHAARRRDRAGTSGSAASQARCRHPQSTPRPGQILSGPRPPMPPDARVPLRPPRLLAPGCRGRRSAPRRPEPRPAGQRPSLPGCPLRPRRSKAAPRGQPVARPVVPPRPDLAARLGRRGHRCPAAPPATASAAFPSAPSSPVPGQPIYRGPIRPGQPLVARPGVAARRVPSAGPSRVRAVRDRSIHVARPHGWPGLAPPLRSNSRVASRR